MNALIAFLDKSPSRTALLTGLGMAAVVGTALLFEHVGGYLPCKLCLEQRTPYYIGAPLMIAAGLFHGKVPSGVTRGMALIGGLLMLYGAALATYHAGIEWAFWAGPADCTGTGANVTTNAGDLLGDLNAKTPPMCDKAALRILGLSMAGWNVPASLALMITSLFAAKRD